MVQRTLKVARKLETKLSSSFLDLRAGRISWQACRWRGMWQTFGWMTKLGIWEHSEDFWAVWPLNSSLCWMDSNFSLGTDSKRARCDKLKNPSYSRSFTRNWSLFPWYLGHTLEKSVGNLPGSRSSCQSRREPRTRKTGSIIEQRAIA